MHDESVYELAIPPSRCTTHHACDCREWMIANSRAALADIMSMTVDHLDDPRLRLIHGAAQRGVEWPE